MDMKQHVTKKNESVRKSENTLRQMKMEIQHLKNLQDAAKAVLRGTLIAINAQSKKDPHKQPNVHLKEPEKEEQTKPKGSIRNYIIKIRTEINKKNKTKSSFVIM